MGYTHYWRRPKEIDRKRFSLIVRDFKRVMPTLEHLGIKLADGYGENKPVVNIHRVWFNGLAKCGHEKHDYGIPWPAENAKGVVLSGMPKNEVLGGIWFAGALLNARTCNGDCSHETFNFPRQMNRKNSLLIKDGEMFFDCCKTAYKPYDFAVNVFLIIAKHYLKDDIIVTSDGTIEQWQDAIDFVQRFLDYGQDFQLAN